MLWKCTLGLLLLGASGAWAQEAAALTEPQYVDQYFALGAGGKLEPLERGTLAFQSKTSNRFISVKSTSSQTVPGKASPVRLAPDTHFVVRMQLGEMDPNTLIHLKPFTAKKNDRELVTGSADAGMFRGAAGKSADDNSIPVSVKKYGSNSVEIVASRPLAPGEYCSTAAMSANCFGVDAK